MPFVVAWRVVGWLGDFDNEFQNFFIFAVGAD